MKRHSITYKKEQTNGILTLKHDFYHVIQIFYGGNKNVHVNKPLVDVYWSDLYTHPIVIVSITHPIYKRGFLPLYYNATNSSKLTALLM